MHTLFKCIKIAVKNQCIRYLKCVKIAVRNLIRAPFLNALK